jgi:hypothetical protein
LLLLQELDSSLRRVFQTVIAEPLPVEVEILLLSLASVERDAHAGEQEGQKILDL